jgi:hypothetical protein
LLTAPWWSVVVAQHCFTVLRSCVEAISSGQFARPCVTFLPELCFERLSDV